MTWISEQMQYIKMLQTTVNNSKAEQHTAITNCFNLWNFFKSLL